MTQENDYEEFEDDLVFDTPIDDLIEYVKTNNIDLNRRHADGIQTIMNRYDV